MNAIWQDRLAYFSWHFLGEFFLHSYIFLGEKSVCDITIIVWFSSKVTTLNSNFLMVHSSENILFLYLHFNWLYGLWNHQRILKKHSFWKYDGWFSSEVSKLASVRNKLIMSLKYWFMEAKNVFRSCYVPKNDQNII